MLDQITHLFRLQAIVEEGSLRRAAERLNLTQPALSRSLAQLEGHFGQPLVERHARGVRPTPFGDKVLSASLRLMRHWELAEQDLMSETAAGATQLRIGAGPIWRAGNLAEIFVEMQRRFPRIVLHQQTYRFGSSLTDLQEGRLDILFSGVSIDQSRSQRLVAHRLTTVTNSVMAREGHPILQETAEGAPLREQRLLDFPWVVYTEIPIYRDTTIHALGERLGRQPEVRLVCENLLTTLTILQRSDCLCLLPEFAVTAMSAPRIVPLPLELSNRASQAGILYREEHRTWEPVQTLVALCDQRFGTGEDTV